MKVFAFLTAICCVSVFGQSPIDGMPNAKGVFYKSGSQWSSLSFNMLFPTVHGATREFLNLGRRQYIAEVAGQHASLAVSDQQPVFFVRGLTNGIAPRLIQYTNKKDYRQLKMKQASLFAPEVPIAEQDIREMEIAVLSNDIIAVRPKGTLPPGEYAIVTNPLSDSRRMMMSFDFRIAR